MAAIGDDPIVTEDFRLLLGDGSVFRVGETGGCKPDDDGGPFPVKIGGGTDLVGAPEPARLPKESSPAVNKEE